MQHQPCKQSVCFSGNIKFSPVPSSHCSAFGLTYLVNISNVNSGSFAAFKKNLFVSISVAPCGKYTVYKNMRYYIQISQIILWLLALPLFLQLLYAFLFLLSSKHSLSFSFFTSQPFHLQSYTQRCSIYHLCIDSHTFNQSHALSQIAASSLIIFNSILSLFSHKSLYIISALQFQSLASLCWAHTLLNAACLFPYYLCHQTWTYLAPSAVRFGQKTFHFWCKTSVWSLYYYISTVANYWPSICYVTLLLP